MGACILPLIPHRSLLYRCHERKRNSLLRHGDAVQLISLTLWWHLIRGVSIDMWVRRGLEIRFGFLNKIGSRQLRLGNGMAPRGC